MTLRILFFCLLALSLSLSSCNPDCDAVSGLRLYATPDFEVAAPIESNVAGYQVLITANPPTALHGRKVLFNNTAVPRSSIQQVPQGLIVTIPENLASGTERNAVNVSVEDPDCGGIMSVPLDVLGQNYISANLGEFVFPPLPEIIIPSLPPVFPPSIENAWLSPNNTDYCAWFRFVKEDGRCTGTIEPNESFEQSTCGNTNVPYAKNRMFGFIDKERNLVNMTISRADGIEEFEGQLLDVTDSQIPEKYTSWEQFCGITPGAEFEQRLYMMLLTSKRTGRQLLLYQQGLPADSDPNNDATFKQCN